jgi:Zn-dependent metalloprotease
VVLPLDRGGYALAWRVESRAERALRISFVDARTGTVLVEYTASTRAAVACYSSNLIYRNESGALAEAFADVMAAAVEPVARRTASSLANADCLAREDDVSGTGLRSFETPTVSGRPDHYSHRDTGAADNGGVHANSSVASHAYYLAIEGGSNRTSGLSVAGVGRANRGQIEKVFSRAFAYLLPSSATFAMARAATIQAARDLYGTGSAAERAVTQAWTAVGVR